MKSKMKSYVGTHIFMNIGVFNFFRENLRNTVTFSTKWIGTSIFQIGQYFNPTF